MIRLIRNKDLYGFGLFMLILVMIAYQELVSPAIGIFLIILIVEGLFFKTLKFRFNKVTVIFIGLFLFYLLGLTWAEHQDIGLKLLEFKMVFFIFPIVFFFIKETTNVWDILDALIWACVILVLRFLIAHFYSHPELSFYDISRQIINLHPTYSSAYFTIAVAYLINTSYRKNDKWPLAVTIVLIILFMSLSILMTSLSAILFLIIGVFVFFGWLIYRKFKWIGLVFLIVSAPFALYLLVIKMDDLKYDIEIVESILSEIKEGKESFLEKNKNEESGNKERVILWMISAEIISENPFGVGTGDIDFYLDNKCDKYGLNLIKEQKLNPHNQFLQIGIDLGIPGILFLFFLFGSILYFAIRNRNYFLMIISINLIFNSFFESVLQRQSGIIPYTFFIVLIICYNFQMTSNKELEKAQLLKKNLP